MSSNEQKARMAGMAGETGGGKAPKYQLPLIKFNGNTGEFRMRDPETGEETSLPKQISLTVLKNRKKLDHVESGFGSTEYTSTGQNITLFKKGNDGKYSTEIGTPTSLRAKYPQLKTQEVLYVLYEGKICQLVVKGGSSRNFYDYKTTLKDLGVHMFEVITNIGQVSDVGKMNKKFYKMTFVSSESTLSLDEIEEKMNEVTEGLRPIDEYNSSKMLENANNAGNVTTAPAAETEDEISWGDDE